MCIDYNELMDVHCSNASGEISGREIQKQLGVLHNNPPPSPLYQNALQDIVKHSDKAEKEEDYLLKQ